MRKIYFLLLTILFAAISNAQVVGYSFSSTSGTFTAISGGTTAFAIGSGWDDGTLTAQPIGFSFTYNGTSYTTFGMSANGYIIMGNGAVTTTYCGPQGAGSNPNMINCLGTDLIPVSAAAGEVRYQTIGGSPNRQLVIQWKNVKHYGAGGDDWTAQLILNETTNSIQVVFGSYVQVATMGANTCADASTESPGIGLVGTAITDFNIRSVTNGTNTWATSVAGATIAAVCNSSPTNIPASGLTWTWTPPPPCVTPPAQPTGLTLTPVSSSQINGSFTAAASTDGYLIVRYPTGSGTTNPANGTTYATGSSLGSGRVVAASSSTSFNATGLSGSTTYDFYVYSYNNLCTGGPLYLTTSPLTATQTTLPCSGLAGGTYTVGATGNYTTLTSAMIAINGGITGPVTLALQNDYNSSGETFPITIAANSCITPTNTLTIKPGSGVTASISGSLNSGALVKVLASNVIIDGSNNGTSSRNLTIANTSVTTPSVLLIGSTGTNAITNVTLKNSIIINGVNSASAVVVSDGATLGTAGYFNNITIQNNSVQRAFIGVYGIAVVTPGNGSGLLYTGNDLNTSGANSIRLAALYVQGVDGPTVSNNNIGNMANTTDASNLTGIWFATGTVNGIISGNTINGMSGTLTAPRGVAISTGVAASNINMTNNTITGLTSSTTQITMGTYLFSTTGGVTIQKNKISNIKNTSATSTGAYGLNLATTNLGANINVNNNFVFDIASLGSATSTSNGIGIVISAGSGYNVYFNSVNLNTDQTAAAGIPSAINITSGVTAAGAIDLRDNIFSTSQTIGTNRYAIYSGAANTVFSNINYNDYYSAGPNLGFIGSNRVDLTAIQAGFGGNANSTNIQPNFMSPVDLHLNPGFNNTLNNTGTAIGGITTDIDGDTRTGPDMGADEFAPCSPAPTATASSNSPVCAGGTLNLTGTSTGTSFSWIGPNGFNSTSQNPSIPAVTTAAAGLYTFQAFLAGCPSLASSTNVVVNSSPSITSVTATPPSVCFNGSSQLNVVANGTLGYGAPVTVPFAPIASGSGTITLASGGTAVTALTSGSLDDGYWNGLTLPFPFTYYGTSYTSFSVGTNGIVSLSPLTTTTGYGSSPQMPNTAVPNNMIAVIGDMEWRFGGVISCYTSGSAPNRIFVINFNGTTGGGFYNLGGAPTALVIFQIQLFEGSNKIQFHTTSITTDASHLHTMGIENSGGTAAVVVPGRDNSLWSLTNDGTEIGSNPVTYSWSPATFLNNTTIANPLASNITATTTYTVTVSQSNGCSSTANTTVTMNSPVISGQTIVQPTSCVSNDGSITITVTGGATGTGPYTFAWTGSGTGLNPTAQNQTGLSIGTYTVTITDVPSGCQTVQAFALPGPGGCICPTISALSTNPSPNGCINTNITLNATGLANMGTSYGITFKYSTSPLADPYVGGTVIANVPNASLTAGGTAASTIATFATANTYYIYAVLFPTPPDPTCRPSQTVTLPVYGNPSFTSQPVNRTICSGQTTTFAVTTSGTPVTYQWQINQGAGFVNLAEVAPFSGTQTATLTVTGATTVYNGNTFRVILGPCGGATSNIVTLTVNALPVITVGPNGLCAPVTLVASGNSDTYSWSPATGLNITTGTTVIATPAVNTTYTVTGTITATGCQNSATVSVRGNSTAAVLSGASTICNTQTANLVVTITGGVGPFTVVYNNGTSNVTVNNYNSGANIPVTPSTTTTYTLVSVTGANGCAGSGINATPVTITVNPLPTVAVGPNNQCSPVTLTATGNSNTYSWSPATGLSATTGPTVTATTTTTTTYTVTGTITATGCQNTATATVLGTPLTPVLSPTSANVCLGSIVQLNATATPTATWSPATGLYTDVTAVTPYVAGTLTNTVYAKPTTTTTYSVISTSGTCPSPAATITVTVTQPVSITTQPVNTTVCVGSNTTISVVAAGNLLNYQWKVSTDNGVTFTNLTNTAPYNNVNSSTLSITNAAISMNNYRYQVVVSNSCGSLPSNSVTLTVNALTTLTVTPLNNRICLSDSLVNLVGSPAGGVWSGIGVYGNTFIPMRTSIGTYTLTYTFTNASSCVSSATVVAKVEDCPERIRELGDKGVLLYPNPNNGLFNLRVNSTLYNYLGVRVYTSSGSLVKLLQWSNLQYGRIIPIDLSKLPAAVYQVEVYYDDGARTAKKTFSVIIAH